MRSNFLHNISAASSSVTSSGSFLLSSGDPDDCIVFCHPTGKSPFSEKVSVYTGIIFRRAIFPELSLFEILPMMSPLEAAQEGEGRRQ